MSIKDGVANAVLVCMGVKGNEVVSIIADEANREIARVFFEIASEASPYTSMAIIPEIDPEHPEPPKNIAAMMAESDVIFLPTTRSLTHTKARINANENGARIASMPGINEYILSRGGMTADYLQIQKDVKKMGRRLRKVHELRIVSPAGTDVTMKLKGRHWIVADTGICHGRGGFTNLPAGSIFIPPVEKSVNGTIVFDGGIEGNLDLTPTVEIENGRMVTVPKELRNLSILKNEKKICAYTVSQVGFGLNPKATIIGNILQDEKAFGTVHIGFGENRSFGGSIRCRVHYEGIIKSPTVYADGEIIIDDGDIPILHEKK